MNSASITANGTTGNEKSRGNLALEYRQRMRRRSLLLVGLLGLTIVSLVINLTSGPANLPFATLWQAVTSPEQLSGGTAVILWDIRLPVAVLAICVGAALGLAGAEMQTMLNNPLASPFTLGISGAATLGAAIAIVFQPSFGAIPSHYVEATFAFIAAALAISLILSLARFYGASVGVVVLFGITLYFAMNALIWLLQYISNDDAMTQIVFFSMGSLSRATWPKIMLISAVLVISLLLSMRYAGAMTVLRNGEDHARSIGINVKRLRLQVLLKVSLLTAVAICFVGEIGFIGLVAPHISRMLLGENQRLYMLGSALVGGLLLSIAAILSKVVIEGVILPIGIVTAMIGIPLFCTLVITRARTL
ncbi:MAG: iron ABC transporter permease [Kangiellaceae bacterium]|nr:iron ABC transporter permease [Kangiellaceae bacterium]|tara:strand:+ start:4372 stop:5460 length:1089 start_codon:yes stop_codon:yes gene_type:complete